MADDKKDLIEPIADGTFDDVVNAVAGVPDGPPTANATHKGILPLGGLQLECYVLDDGRRVFNKRGMAEAIGLKSRGGNAFMRAMQAQSLGSELDENLLEKINNPIFFNPLSGDPNLGHGYEAEVLVEVCKAVIRADKAGRLKAQQANMVAQANIILNALASVGIVALVDEATGYQTQRDPDALRLLVQAYIEKEQREWEKEFPDDFYLSLNRVYGSEEYVARASGAMVINKPQHFGNFTRKYVYGPLENGEVLAELEKKNPKVGATGTRPQRFHQYLTKGYGLEKLREQRQEVLTMLKLSDNIDEFKRLYEKRFGPLDDQYSMWPDFFDPAK